MRKYFLGLCSAGLIFALDSFASNLDALDDQQQASQPAPTSSTVQARAEEARPFEFIPNFIPTPSDQLAPGEARKRILIMGAHPDENRWTHRWQNLAASYDLVFVSDYSFSFSGGEVGDDPQLGEGKIARTPNGQVEVWSIDFNSAEFRAKMRSIADNPNKALKFDLVICDYSVYKSFHDDPIENSPVVACASVLKPEGFCVLGALGVPGDVYTIIKSLSAEDANWKSSVFSTSGYLSSSGSRRLYWNIGKTEADKAADIAWVREESDLSPGERAAHIRRIEEASREITPQNATRAVNAVLGAQNTAGRGWERISLIQTVKNTDILPQLAQIIGGDIYREGEEGRKWMIITPDRSAAASAVSSASALSVPTDVSASASSSAAPASSNSRPSARLSNNPFRNFSRQSSQARTTPMTRVPPTAQTGNHRPDRIFQASPTTPSLNPPTSSSLSSSSSARPSANPFRNFSRQSSQARTTPMTRVPPTAQTGNHRPDRISQASPTTPSLNPPTSSSLSSSSSASRSTQQPLPGPAAVPEASPLLPQFNVVSAHSMFRTFPNQPSLQRVYLAGMPNTVMVHTYNYFPSVVFTGRITSLAAVNSALGIFGAAVGGGFNNEMTVTVQKRVCAPENAGLLLFRPGWEYVDSVARNPRLEQTFGYTAETMVFFTDGRTQRYDFNQACYMHRVGGNMTASPNDADDAHEKMGWNYFRNINSTNIATVQAIVYHVRYNEGPLAGQDRVGVIFIQNDFRGNNLQTFLNGLHIHENHVVLQNIITALLQGAVPDKR